MLMKPYVLLLRPPNFLITVASVFVSSLLAGGRSEHLTSMILAAVSAGLIGGGGMVVNDIFDVEIDRINKPDRPLPSGNVAQGAAALFYGCVSALGLLLNLFLHSSAQLIAAGAFVLIFFYGYRLKSTPLFGNLAVGVLTGLAFIYGGAAVRNLERAAIPALFAFLINVGREIIKDMEDVEGDARMKAVTFPVRYGLKPAAGVATIFLLAVIGSTIIPFANHQYGMLYLILVMIGVNCVIGFVLYKLWEDVSPRNLNRLSTILKYDMVVGLVAIYLG